MKTMKSFAAQQLTKSQMVNVRGGNVRTSCLLELKDGSAIELGTINRADFDQVEKEMNAAYEGVGHVICDPWLL